jgi:hypothetical protein
MLSCIVGLGVAVLSLYCIFCWSNEFFVFLKGVLPFSFFIAGVVAMFAGASGMRSKHYEKLKTKDK